MTQCNERDWVESIAEPAYASIREMVECLEADRDRLDELQTERDDWVENDGGDDDEQARTVEDWASEFPADAEELAELEQAVTIDGDELDEDQARQRIEEDALSLRVFGERVGGEWQAETYELLLATGGPAVRIVGELDQYGEPSTARLEVQDWFKPWTEYHEADDNVLLTYARCFYYAD